MEPVNLVDNINAVDSSQGLQRLLRSPPATPMSSRSRADVMLRMLSTTINAILEATDNDETDAH